MIYVKAKKTRKRGLKFYAILFLVFLVGILCYLNFVVNPVVFHMSQSKVKSLVSREMHNAVFETVGYDNLYDSLIMIIRNEEGDIVMMQSNAVQINHLAREISRTAQSKMENVGVDGVDIPIGSFSGMPIFAGRGPTVRIKMLPVGSVNCTFSSDFISQGVNQTNHRIYLHVSANVQIILPTENRSVSFESQILISECIIVGKVPQTYLNSQSLDEMMNLIPN